MEIWGNNPVLEDFWAQGIAWGGCGCPISQDFEAQKSQEFPAKPALTGG